MQAIHADFHQDPPALGNTFEADVALQETLSRLVPPELHGGLCDEWRALGAAAAGPLLELARQAEAQPPRLVSFDAWGRRVDRLELAPAWRALHREAARHGLAAVPYDGRLGPHARLHHFALLLLYGPSSAIYNCPLAMTDGAARTLVEHDAALAARVLPRLTSRDPDALWTSGQWMTERTGGSDVSDTRTVAIRAEGDAYRLHGVKWFTSATGSEVALTLARLAGAPAGSEGLSLFYLEQCLPDGSTNGIRVLRLKDKLGTRALPTAELELAGCLAFPVGPLGDGVRKITPLLNVTRLHNAVAACGVMARALQLLRDYARRRRAFGAALADKPLHRETLAALQVEYEAALALVFECARLLGRRETGAASESETLRLRLLTPLVKLMTGKQAVAVASEALEGFGGAGYVEDTGLPALLRDAQVLPIWEGTTNVLSLDVLRAAAKDGALEALLEDARARLQALAESPLAELAPPLAAHAERLERALVGGAAAPLATEAQARRLALGLAGLAAALPLAEQAVWALAAGRSSRAAHAARRWVGERLLAPLAGDAAGARLEPSALLSGLG